MEMADGQGCFLVDPWPRRKMTGHHGCDAYEVSAPICFCSLVLQRLHNGDLLNEVV
jgi:hypothetical protein